MSYVDIGLGLSTSITIEIIGSGLNISAPSLELVKLTGISSSAVNRTLEELEMLELVQREADPTGKPGWPAGV